MLDFLFGKKKPRRRRTKKQKIASLRKRANSLGMTVMSKSYASSLKKKRYKKPRRRYSRY